MSQNRHKNSEFKSIHSMGNSKCGHANFERNFYSVLLLCLAAMFFFAATSAQAAVTTTKSGKNPTYILKTNLDTMAGRDSAILDWRTQEFELAFDLPANDWYESLDLFISAYPEGQVARGTPLLISYNGAKPVPIYGRASRFDAHIRMDTSRIRLSGNSIKISYQTPRNADCLLPSNGQWVLDLSRSKLVAKARTKKRAMQISEIEQRLAHPMTAPKRVNITAKGTNKLAYTALAAQGIAQRMSFVPEFKLGGKLSDMQFIIGTHDDIRPLLNNKSILSAPGARVVIDTGARPKIVLTAETEEQVLELVRAFATYHMPKARRSHMFLHEFYSGAKLAPRAIVGAGKYKLSDIGAPVLTHSWRPEPAVIDFNVADPHATSGVLTLKILSAKDINPKSRVKVKLNDTSIGYTRLNKSSKMVEFRIKPGMLMASNNKISIEPEIKPDTSAGASENLCQVQQYIPTIMVSNASKFHLTSTRPTPATDLSRFAASGAPFDKDSVLVLTAKSVQDKQASLRFLGLAARQFGPKWTDAEYVSALPENGKIDKNILIIGPNPLRDPALFAAAPSALKLVLGKTKTQRPNGRKIASADQFASRSSDQTFKIAARNTQTTRLKSGGLAALFPSPHGGGRMIGVISSDRPAKFSTAMQSVVNNDFWNGLQGSVARWDKSTILMAQTATPLPIGFGLPKTAPATGATKFVSSAKNWFASLSFGNPKKATPYQAEQLPVPASQPVQTASNSPQIGVVRTAAPAQQLRGSLPTRPDIRRAPETKTKWKLALPTFSKPALPSLEMPALEMPSLNIPSMTKLKLKGYQTKRDIQAWWGKTSTQAFEATPMRKWWKDITQNRMAFFGLIVFLAFFITALASPMSIRRKKN